MPNPINVERAFVKLIQSLDGALSFKNRWLKIYDFFQLIEGSFSAFDTYCIQLIHRLPVFEHPISFTGMNPQNLLSINRQLDKLREAIPAINRDQQLEESQESLQCAIIFLYACLGDIKSGLQALHFETESIESQCGDPEAVLSQLINGRKTLVVSKVECLKKVLQWWRKIEKQEPHSVFVPVVENHSSATIGGRLRRLKSIVIGIRDDRDHYESHYYVVGAERGETKGDVSVSQQVRNIS